MLLLLQTDQIDLVQIKKKKKKTIPESGVKILCVVIENLTCYRELKIYDMLQGVENLQHIIGCYRELQICDIQLYYFCVEKFAFIYSETFNKINNKTSTTQ